MAVIALDPLSLQYAGSEAHSARFKNKGKLFRERRDKSSERFAPTVAAQKARSNGLQNYGNLFV